MTVTDEELLGQEAASSFELFYDRHFERVLAFFARRTLDPELAADLTAETFAAVLFGPPALPPAGRSGVLVAVRDCVPQAGRRPAAGLRRRSSSPAAGDRADRATDDDIARIDRLGETDAVAQLVQELPTDQREAITARVIHERQYDEIARELQLSETVVRKRVSRGLAALRRRIGGPS